MAGIGNAEVVNERIRKRQRRRGGEMGGRA